MHRYRIQEIADQAGLSQATVDRVLNGRPGVRRSTADQVQRAVDELDRQRDQVQLGGRTFRVDLVMQAPSRFSSSVRSALEAELPGLRPAVIRSRFHLREEGQPAELAQVLDGIGRRGSAGVLLKAPDHPAVVDAVTRLHEQGVPVVTLVTDLPLSPRIAYVGIDNRAAGATAAYLVAHLSRSTGSVLVTLSSSSFRGEEERESGFRSAMRTLAPGRGVLEVSETDGLDATMYAAVARVLALHPDIDAVYSAGGGNTATLDAFRQAGRTPAAFVAHDLDGDNTTLLRRQSITAVLHHDLRADLRHACQLVLQAHGALPGPPRSRPSQVQVITPFNQPTYATSV
ncbi:LacI family DNA-binding transcriptional regulator [Microlunatus antarcticus]|uniref:LacI family transcriptional regulator n=1 Tax=Microlunatus antarcticus TaxID=53388 RepID=A0A7W5JW98_9ACTN|nr:LacI family transcriptional regulator [Microlunatus antarcticus]